MRVNTLRKIIEEIDDKNVSLNIDIKGDNWRDIDYLYQFADSVSFLSDKFMEGYFELQTKVDGGFNNLTIKQFDFRYLDSIQVTANGNIKEPMNIDLLDFSILSDEKQFVSFERLPVDFNEKLYQYNYKDFAYTTINLKPDAQILNIYKIEKGMFIQLN